MTSPRELALTLAIICSVFVIATLVPLPLLMLISIDRSSKYPLLEALGYTIMLSVPFYVAYRAISESLALYP